MNRNRRKIFVQLVEIGLKRGAFRLNSIELAPQRPNLISASRGPPLHSGLGIPEELCGKLANCIIEFWGEEVRARRNTNTSCLIEGTKRAGHKAGAVKFIYTIVVGLATRKVRSLGKTSVLLRPTC